MSLNHVLIYLSNLGSGEKCTNPRPRSFPYCCVVQVDASKFEPGQLRVRMIMAAAGTTDQLRQATAAFLSATHSRNPVSHCLYAHVISSS